LKKEAEGFIVDEEVEEEEEAEDSDSNVEEKEDEDSDMDIRNEVADLLEQVNDN